MAAKDNAETLTVAGREVRVTNPDKPYFSREAKLTKIEIVRYYLAIADGAVAGIRDRPVVLKRFVDGAEGQPFYQKRAPDNRPPWLRTVTLSFPSGRTAEEVVVDDAAGLAWIVNLGCIELHPHAVRAGDLDHPDELRVDLDPGPGVAWADVRAGRAGGERAARRAGAARLAQDQRLARHPRQRAHRAALVVHRRAARRAGAVARDRTARAHDRDVEVVEGGTPRRVPRLQPEREGSNDLLGVFGPPAARRARVGADDVGRGRGLRPRRLHGADDAGPLRGDAAIRTPAWTPRRDCWSNCSSSRRATRRRASPMRPGRRTTRRRRARRRASRPPARRRRRRERRSARRARACRS